MSQLIFTLGYTLNDDNSIPITLENRLKETISLYKGLKDPKIMVTGSIPYVGKMSATKSQASIMKDYLLQKGIPPNDIFTEEETQSSIEQLCWLRDKIERDSFLFDLPNEVYIIATEGFDNRVELFCKYILHNSIKYCIIGTDVDKRLRQEFLELEKEKYKQSREWFEKEFIINDYQQILSKQLDFQNNKLKQKGYPVHNKI